MIPSYLTPPDRWIEAKPHPNWWPPTGDPLALDTSERPPRARHSSGAAPNFRMRDHVIVMVMTRHIEVMIGTE